MLAKDAAQAYNALNRKLGGRLKHAGEGACYRPLGRPGDYKRGGPFTQWYAWEKYQSGAGNLAARPGTSNHGAGRACDFSGDAINLVKAYGAPFGWKKTEAFGEPWHYCYVPGSYPAVGKYSAKQAGETLSPGDTGPGIVAMKNRLKAWNAWPRLWRVDDKYAGRTGQAVKAFQKAHKLTADGIVGKATWAALNGKPPVKKPARPIVKPKPIPAKPAAAEVKYFADIYSGDSNYDPKAYRKAGYWRIALKATEGKTFEDPVFVKRWEASAGMSRIAYHFARPSNNSPGDEAANLAKVLGKVHFTPSDRIALDWEDPKWSANGDKWIQLFVDALARYGYDVRILYSYGPYIEQTVRTWPKSRGGHPLRYWHAAYNAHPEANVPAIAKPNLWAVQYTDGQSGNEPRSVVGIGHCDLSYTV